MKIALIPPATGNVTSHAYTIDLKSDQSTFFPLNLSPKKQPMKTTLPTMQWVLETGMPILLASRTVVAAEVSTVKPLKKFIKFKKSFKKFKSHVVGVIFVIFFPTVSLTLLPNIHIPRAIPKPPKHKIQIGDSACFKTENSE